jgi:hypothetical protein
MFRKNILFVLALVLFSCQGKKANNLTIEKSNKEREDIQSEVKWIITPEGIGNIKLGNSLTKTMYELSKEYTVKKSPHLWSNSCNIYENGKEIVLISADLKTDKIDYIRIYTDKWKSECGLRVGMSIKKINEFYKDFFIEYDVSTGSEYFPKREKIKISKKFYKSISKFNFRATSLEYIGNYDFNEVKKTRHKSTNNNEKATLSSITLNTIEI